MCKDLPVGYGMESGVESVVDFGADAFAKVVAIVLVASDVTLTVDVDVQMEPKSVEDEVAKRGVEIDEAQRLSVGIDERLVEYAMEVVGVVLEVGAGAVGADDGVPVLAAPFTVVADEDAVHGSLRDASRRASIRQVFGRSDGNGQRDGAVVAGDDATVAVSLFDVVIRLLFDDDAFAPVSTRLRQCATIQLGIIVHWRKIGGGENHSDELVT